MKMNKTNEVSLKADSVLLFIEITQKQDDNLLFYDSLMNNEIVNNMISLS